MQKKKEKRWESVDSSFLYTLDCNIPFYPFLSILFFSGARSLQTPVKNRRGGKRRALPFFSLLIPQINSNPPLENNEGKRSKWSVEWREIRKKEGKSVVVPLSFSLKFGVNKGVKVTIQTPEPFLAPSVPLVLVEWQWQKRLQWTLHKGFSMQWKTILMVNSVA